MSIELPPPISLYLKIENSGDAASLPQCFAANATVRDEGHVYQGLPAIKEWLAGTKKKYNHDIAPISVADQDGKKVVTATLAGTFPGSPLTLKFNFALEAGKIVSLQIGS